MEETPHASSSLTIASAVAFAAVAAGALVVSPVTLFVFVLALLLIAAGEIFRLTRRLGVVPLPLVGFATVASLCALSYRGADTLLTYGGGVIGAGLGITMVARIVRGQVTGAVASVITTIAPAIYVGLLGSFIIAMRRSPYGFRITLAFALMTLLNDAAAWFTRHAFARPQPEGPDSAADSTGSTVRSALWRPMVAGTAATFAAAVAIALTMNPPFTVSRAMLLAALVSVMLPLGDQAETAITREAGLAASGRSLPGHGGVLDRLDGLLFAAPVFYLAVHAMIR